jgi:CheY-like chemotaxis protein
VAPTREPILVVDDFADGLEMYGEFLTFHGYRVLLARNGQEAVDLARAETPALILMDLQMPMMNGVEALRLLRSDSAFSRTAIVALTAHAMTAEREEALREGFDEVIAKPCLPEDLLAAIERILASEREP